MGANQNPGLESVTGVSLFIPGEAHSRIWRTIPGRGADCPRNNIAGSGRALAEFSVRKRQQGRYRPDNKRVTMAGGIFPLAVIDSGITPNPGPDWARRLQPQSFVQASTAGFRPAIPATKFGNGDHHVAGRIVCGKGGNLIRKTEAIRRMDSGMAPNAKPS